MGAYSIRHIYMLSRPIPLRLVECFVLSRRGLCVSYNSALIETKFCYDRASIALICRETKKIILGFTVSTVFVAHLTYLSFHVSPVLNVYLFFLGLMRKSKNVLTPKERRFVGKNGGPGLFFKLLI